MKLEFITFSLAITTLGAGCIADIRPDSLTGASLDHEALKARGRAMLARTAQAHGQAAWQEVDTYSVTLRDEWQGFLIASQSPWGEPEVDVTLDYLAGTFDGRANFESGVNEGMIWGMQSWETYWIGTDGSVEFAHDEDVAFILPAIQYLGEFVHRAGAATIVMDAGRGEVAGKSYERVFVTWEQLEPHMGADQYMLYIDPETWRAAKIQYTVRDAYRFLQGTIHFDDYREVEGVWFPFWQSVTLGLDDDPASDYAHLMTVKEMRFDAVERRIFRVREGLGASQDAKP